LVAVETQQLREPIAVIFQNRMKRTLKDGKVVFGPMVSEMRSSGIAVLFAQAGFDFFFVDLEHSCFSLETVSDMILAARAADIPVIVRPSSRKGAAYLSRPLDIGASGLLIPQIRTREDVENVVKWCRYQPLGERGMGLARQHTFFQGGNARETMNSLNEEVLIALQIENKEAVENLSDLLSVPGIDAAFVGPADLSAAFGKPGRSDDPEILGAIDRVIEVCEANGVIPGIHTSSVAKARFWVEKGMKMIGFKLIQQVCRASVQELHAAQ
jgi:4-hydroxy-2-oxoheptanedioate aldolase